MTYRAFLPFHVMTSHAVAAKLGRKAERAAVLALRAILQSHRQLEVAHQQVLFGEHNLAFSSRITARGELVIELEIGDPRLEGRIILEDDLNRAVRKVRGIAGDGRRRTTV
ncbi:hypothetical protein [Hyphomicrobium sp.]|uniref:hypothetical protein n=1 Tax=Hyphomicrobium sp. TaxID=82 RepID=UPI0025BC16FA|nr:hypothetical protein [Hyphomicrobium sp.]MCC7253819.1 hypothetical protein [Hyphomicrobium sp.]